MPRALTNNRLLRIARANQEAIKKWKEGVSIERDAGRSVSQLICLVSADRWKLAYEYKRHANKIFLIQPTLYRSSISRYYYAMYHAMRSCVYIYHGGDDFEEHSKLPLYIPSDFPPGIDWQNILKNARLVRNRADYDPYPKSDKAWKGEALSIKADTELLLLTSRSYLRSKGCAL